MQKIIEERYLLNLTSVPLSPDIGVKQQNILAVSDLANNLITTTPIFDIEISKDGDVVFSKEDMTAVGGLLAFTYIYPEAGEYEILATFRLPDSDHVYVGDHFMVQVDAGGKAGIDTTAITLIVIALVIGGALGFITGRRKADGRPHGH